MTKFPRKGYVQSTTERVNIIIKFSIIKLEWVPNLTLKKIFGFGPNLSKMGRKMSRGEIHC